MGTGGKIFGSTDIAQSPVTDEPETSAEDAYAEVRSLYVRI